PTTDEPEQYVEDPASVGAHRHRRPEQHLASVGNDGLVGGLLPRLGNVDAESPGVRRVGLCAAENAARLVVRRVVAVCVDRGGARLKPDARWPGGLSDGPADNGGRSDT